MKVIVVVCTHAGTFAIKRAIADHPDAEVTVYEKNDNISFLSCGIALYLGKEIKNNDPQGLFYSSPEELESLGANVQMKHEVTEIDSKAKTIKVKDLTSGEEKEETYDKLIMTTGSLPIVPPIPGIDSKRVYLCKNWNDAKKLFDEAPKAKSITVIGSGYIGAELAEAYSNQNFDVNLVDGSERVLYKYFDPKFTEILAEDYENHGVNLELGSKVAAFEEQADGIIVKTNDDKEIKSDIAILCIGFKPNTSLLDGQVDMMDNGAIITDDYMHSTNHDIFAAGDSAAVHYNPTGQNAYIPLATNAVRQGLLVGENLTEDKTKYMGTQSSSGLKLYGRTYVSTGLNMAAAKAQNINAHQVIVEDNYRPEFMKTTDSVLMSLVYDPDSRRILGGALTSMYDVSQSANVLSVCIQNKNTIDDLAMVDMLFQPQFDRPFNYLNILAQAAQAKETKK
ncbi:FAD-dependent oxidoreductase [Fructilactobacillus lindneri]|uniref:NADH oxidase n=1 Tax=Fructilactobacillus lindneri TaxID=53444 RepID=A0AB33BQP3_9LACO|nr:FAD-dependent oxidoreductase [Fructilactobacillus lindneri]ANZ58418.1 NADH oxidase [Fructilactobacillus lindneri]ANZ59728.1 NADH oxidase [Fructilactobacillus lindneri]POG98477.1 NADH oxidase [Fructilactobacillus lindneri]POH03877.1 NADH oxidase [Fructilactobacillus lindneri]POH04879.1 NADH oxidase [Fructilactobacillus lindneri]